MTFCFKCRACGAQWEHSAQKLGLHPDNGCRSVDIIRDYRAEAANVRMA